MFEVRIVVTGLRGEVTYAFLVNSEEISEHTIQFSGNTRKVAVHEHIVNTSDYYVYEFEIRKPQNNQVEQQRIPVQVDCEPKSDARRLLI